MELEIAGRYSDASRGGVPVAAAGVKSLPARDHSTIHLHVSVTCVPQQSNHVSVQDKVTPRVTSDKARLGTYATHVGALSITWLMSVTCCK
jgi:hypothetical protein